MNQKFLIKQIIKNILLNEAAIDVWKNKNKSLPEEQIKQAEKYFAELTAKYNAALHPTVKNLTELSFEELETLYKTVVITKEKNLKSVYAQWLTKQFKENNLTLQQIIEDYIPPLLSLQKNKDKFDPNFLNSLENIEDLNKELNAKISSEEMAVSDADFGKLAEEDGWILYMPHNTEASCEIGKTGGRRDTTWCTTRSDNNNLFLQYVARPDPDESIILFYVVKKGANAEKDPFAKMSVGFINGEPKFNMGSGNISVNAQNQNLTQKKFEEVLGKELADRFIQIMEQKAASLKGEHPAKEEFRKLVQNPVAFQAKLNSFADDENGRSLRKNFIETALEYNPSPDVLLILINNENLTNISRIFRNRSLSPETLDQFAKNVNVQNNFAVKIEILNHNNIGQKTLEFLANDSDIRFLNYLFKNIIFDDQKVTSKLLDNLAKNIHADFEIKEFVAENPKTLPDTLSLLIKDSSPKVREKAIQNDNIKQEDLLNALEEENELLNVKKIIQNKKLPSDVIEQIINPNSEIYKKIIQNTIKEYNIQDPTELDDTKKFILKLFKSSAVLNQNIKEETLIKLIKEDEKKMDLAIYNPKTPPDLLQLHFDKMINHSVVPTNQSEFEKRFIGFTTNPNTPSDILNKLAVNKQSTKDMLKNIIKNPNVSEETLRYLSSLNPKEIWWYIGIVDNAKKALAEKNQQNLVEALILDKIFSKLLNNKTYRS